MPSKPRNRIGEIYGNLTVLRLSSRRTSAGNAFWWCICTCGKEREVPSDCLSTKRRKKKNVTACRKCSKEIAIEGVCKKNDQEEKKRRQEAFNNRLELIEKIPQEWFELPLTDSHARELGKKQFFRGIRCLNNHLSPYRINGGCLACAKESKQLTKLELDKLI